MNHDIANLVKLAEDGDDLARLELQKLQTALRDTQLNDSVWADFDDPRFSQKIASSFSPHIFNTQSSSRCGNDTFTLTDKQVFVRNYLGPLSPYNSILLYHAMGSGKTCSAVIIAEQLMDADPSRKTLVIVGPHLHDNFRRNIFNIHAIRENSGGSLDLSSINQCTGTKYLEHIPDRHELDLNTLRDRIDRLIDQKYEFLGYLELSNEIERIELDILRGIKDPEKAQSILSKTLDDKFGNRIIIIDEAQNIRNADNTEKRVPQMLMRILHSANNVSLILLSGTPMYNNSREIVLLLNLLLANDKRPEILESDLFDSHDTLTSSGTILLAKLASNYISYIQHDPSNPMYPKRLPLSIDNFTIPSIDIKGNNIPSHLRFSPNPLLPVIQSPFGDFQLKFYQKCEALIRRINLSIDDESSSTDISLTRRISNIAFPVDDIQSAASKDGFLSVFDIIPAKEFRVSYKPDILQSFGGPILHPSLIAHFAPKIKRVTDMILQQDGIVFVYSFYNTAGSIPLAIALEHLGFSRYGMPNILTDSFHSIPSKFSYMILSGEKGLSTNADAALFTSNSPSNSDGSIIKVIIATSVASEGLDLKNIRHVHLLEPWYHINKINQIIGRAIRKCSHASLPVDQQNVSVYMHATILDDARESIDMRTIRIAQLKQNKIDLVESVIRDNALDSHVSPVNPSLHSHSFLSFYDQLYSSFIVSLFKTGPALSFSDIKLRLSQILPDVDDHLLAASLYDIMIHHKIIVDYHGRHNLLIYRSNKYILQPIQFPNDMRLTLQERDGFKSSRNSFFIPNSLSDLDFISLDDSITYVYELVTKLSRSIGVSAINSHPYGPWFLDAAIDRCDAQHVRTLCTSIVLTPPVHDDDDLMIISHSLQDAGILHLDLDPPVMLDRRVWRSLPSLKPVENEHTIAILKQRLYQHVALRDDALSYMEYLPNGSVVSKLVDQKSKYSTGYICEQTSQLSSSMLQSIISDIDPVSFKSSATSKRNMCLILEIMLRKQNLLIRPAFGHALKLRLRKRIESVDLS